jgi:hypothetical protein
MAKANVTNSSFGRVRSVEPNSQPSKHTKQFGEESMIEFKRRKERAGDVSGGCYVWAQDSLRDKYKPHEKRVDASEIGYFGA